MIGSATTRQPTRLPRIALASGSVEGLKWLALVLMTFDHINKYLLDWSVPWMYALGRMAMPIFVVVLAYNLARPRSQMPGVFARTLRRLLITGVVATVPFVLLGKLNAGWWPLNIMFTLALAVWVMQLVTNEQTGHKVAAVLAFAALGSLVEYWWPAVALAVAAFLYFKAPSVLALIAVVGSMALLCTINGNQWAWLGLGVVLVASQLKVNLPIPRSPWAFYAYYPAHLALLYGARSLLA